jgi:peptidoglycan hydrolase-like protein with peptidoglycan-binding domain
MPIQFIDGRRGKPDALPTHPTKRWAKRPVGSIKGMVVHHTAGVNDNPRATAAYHVGASHTSSDGMAGLAYTFFVQRGGQVWLANEPDDRTWSHGGGSAHPDVNGDGVVDRADGLGNANAEFMAVVLAGSFDSRWNKSGSQPTGEQIASLIALWSHLTGFAECADLPAELFSILGHLDIGDIWGHADFGKAACPGDRLLSLTEWLRHGREAARTAEDWQRALVAKGHNLGTFGPTRNGVDGKWGPSSANALRSFQRANGLAPTGDRDAVTERALFA